MTALDHLRSIRRAELAAIADLLPSGTPRVLEIGGGDGFQAAELARRYGWIAVVDLPDAAPLRPSLHPVALFDGRHLPFADGAFDLVFTSHVLEHVGEIVALQAEIQRVMRPGACAVHVLPSATWRIWTLLTHYATLPRRILERLLANPADDGVGCQRPHLGARVMAAAFERRHGARGLALSEIWLYSRLAWRRHFARAGFRVERVRPIGLYYTGYSLLGARLDVARRRGIARLLGSASIVYVVSTATAENGPSKDPRP